MEPAPGPAPSPASEPAAAQPHVLLAVAAKRTQAELDRLHTRLKPLQALALRLSQTANREAQLLPDEQPKEPSVGAALGLRPTAERGRRSWRGRRQSRATEVAARTEDRTARGND